MIIRNVYLKLNSCSKEAELLVMLTGQKTNRLKYVYTFMVAGDLTGKIS